MKREKIFLSLVGTLFLVEGLLAKEPIKLQTVIVSANKIEENKKNVPQSISVIDEFTIQELGIKNISDVVNYIPNMTNIPNYGLDVNFRGLNTSKFTENNPVVIYIDGIPSTNRIGFDVDFQNVKRIEVLRGPQGTLYGKDAIGAVINIVTKEPSNDTNGNVNFEYGNRNTLKSSFNINTPLIENKLFINANGTFFRDDGWITNDFKNDKKANKKEDKKYNLSTIYKVNDQFKAKLVLSKLDSHKAWANWYAKAGGTDIKAFKKSEAEHINYDVPSYGQIDSTSQALALNYNFNKLTFNSTTTHKKTNLDNVSDSDLGVNPYFMGLKLDNKSETNLYTQEFRVSNSKDDIRWIAGLYFDKEKKDQNPYLQQYPFIDRTSGTKLGDYEFNAISKIQSDTKALFGQVMIPFYKNFELTLGGRLQRVRKEIDLKTYNSPMGVNLPASYSLDTKKTWNSFLPKVALSYKIDDSLTSYVSFAKGYMPGGHNTFPRGGSVDDNTFEPQKSNNYEMGLKADYSNLIFTASIFRLDIKDIHIYKFSNPNVLVTGNANKAHSEGIEFDFTYFPTNNLEFYGATGLIKAKFDDYDLGGGMNFNGEDIDQTPSYTINLGVSYTHPTGIYTRLDLKAQDGMSFYDGANAKYVKTDSYMLGNLKIGYKYKDFNVYAFVKNISDKEYIDKFVSSPMTSIAGFGEERTYGIGLRYDF